MVQYMPKQRRNCHSQMESKHDHQVLCKLPDIVQLQVWIGVPHKDFIAAPSSLSRCLLAALSGMVDLGTLAREWSAFIPPGRSIPGTVPHHLDYLSHPVPAFVGPLLS